MHIGSSVKTAIVILLSIIVFIIFVYESIRFDKTKKLYESDPFGDYVEIE